MRRKKVILLFVLSLLMLVLGGCGKESKNANGKGKEVTKGRYVESEVAFPDEINTESIVQLRRDNGKIVIVTVNNNDGYIQIKRFVLDDKDVFTEDTPKWLEDIKVPNSNAYSTKLFSDGQGRQYLYTQMDDTEETGQKPILYCSADGTTSKDITPESWKKINKEWGAFETPVNINVTSDGIITALYYDRTEFYKGEDGSFLSKNQILTGGNENYADNILEVQDNLYILLKQDQNRKPVGLEFYEPQKPDIVKNYKITSKLDGYQYLDINDKGDLVLCNNDGIHVLKAGTTLWQTVVDGTLTSLTMPSLWSKGAIQGEDETYYILYGSDEQNNILMKYVFDPDMPSVPEKELNVFALEENSTIRQAAEIFQKKHPDVRVNVSATMNSEGETKGVANKDDSIRLLNTELLAKAGPDILVLDGLPVDSFVEQGVLMNLNDVVAPMLEKGELFENLIECYIQEDGSIYEVPARFGINLICSKEVDASKVSALDTLADYLKNQKESVMGEITPQDLVDRYEPFMLSRIVEGEKQINRDELIAVLENLKLIGDNSGITEGYGDRRRTFGMWELPSEVGIAMETIEGFNDTMFTMAIVNLVKGSYEAFDNTFIPSCQLGINEASKQKELAQEFLELALSIDIQKYDFYDGFSVNREALMLDSKKDRSGYQAYTQIEIEDGSSIPFTIEIISKKDLDKLIEIFGNLNKKAKSNEILMEGIMKEIPDFLNEKSSAEETADKIMDNTRVYQME